MQGDMEDTSPEAFRRKFAEARRGRRIAITTVMTVSILIGWGLVRIFIDDFTRDTVRWTLVCLIPPALFGWILGRRLGDEYAHDVWKDIRTAQMLAVGGRRKSLAELMAEELGAEETYRRQQEADRGREEEENRPPEAAKPSDASPPPPPDPGPAPVPTADPPEAPPPPAR